MIIDKASVSLIITNLRKSHNYSQQEMADHLLVSLRTVRNWEKGITMPSLEDVARICTVFNLTPDAFFNGGVNDDKNNGSVVSPECKEGIENIIKNGEIIDNNLKYIYDRMSNETEATRKSIILDLKLFLLHTITAFVNFTLFFNGPTAYLISLIVSVVYLTYLTYILLKNKNNSRFIAGIMMYLTILFVNSLILTFLYTASFGNAGFAEFFLFNGSLYGLIIFNANSFLSLLLYERIAYCVVFFMCSYLLCHIDS